MKKAIFTVICVLSLVCITMSMCACNSSQSFSGGIRAANLGYAVDDYDVTNTSLEIDADYANVAIRTGDSDVLNVFYYAENEVIDVQIELLNGGLCINQRVLKKSQVVYGGEIIVEIPTGQNALDAININLRAGNVDVKNIAANSADITVNAGGATINSSSGNLLKVEIDAGEAKISDCEYTSADFDVDCGNLETDAFRCDALQAVVDVGNITVKIVGSKSEYALSGRVSVGKCNFSNQQGTAATKSVSLSVDVGNIELYFSES